MVSAPFMENFMLPVPEASLPAVEICSESSAAGINHLSALHVEVGDEDHAQAIAHRAVGVDGRGHGVNQLDDELGHEVAGRGLAAEDDGARSDGGVSVVLDAVVER